MQKCKVSTLIILRTRMTTSICSEAEILRNIFHTYITIPKKTIQTRTDGRTDNCNKRVASLQKR